MVTLSQKMCVRHNDLTRPGSTSSGRKETQTRTFSVSVTRWARHGRDVGSRPLQPSRSLSLSPAPKQVTVLGDRSPRFPSVPTARPQQRVGGILCLFPILHLTKTKSVSLQLSHVAVRGGKGYGDRKSAESLGIHLLRGHGCWADANSTVPGVVQRSQVRRDTVLTVKRHDRVTSIGSEGQDA